MTLLLRLSLKIHCIPKILCTCSRHIDMLIFTTVGLKRLVKCSAQLAWCMPLLLAPWAYPMWFTRCFILFDSCRACCGCVQSLTHACACAAWCRPIAAAQAGVSVFMSVALTRLLLTVHSANPCQ